MKLPEPSPDPGSLVASVMASHPERFVGLLAAGMKPDVNGRYLHWDELRRRAPPEGFTAEQWWLALVLGRKAVSADLPLVDEQGRRFHFSRTDSSLRMLHVLDRELGGALASSEPQLANAEMRDRYLVRSLAEEAITSSQLEGASTTRQVAKEMLLSGRTPTTHDEQMIANNFLAMQWVREKKAEPLTPELILELHTILTQGTLDSGEVGRWRRSDEQVLVQDRADGQVLHVPPPAKDLQARIARLCAFANATADDAFLHPIVRAIVLHFAIGYEHPFVDGNGRTARSLFYWSLLRQNYWLAEFLSISRVIKKAPSQYVRAYLYVETDRGDLTYFLLHQLEVLQQASRDLHQYLAAKADQLREAERLMRGGERFNHRQRALLAHAIRHPDARYTIAAYQREHNVVYETARRDLMELAETGLLEKRQVGRAFHFGVVPGLDRRIRERGGKE